MKRKVRRHFFCYEYYPLFQINHHGFEREDFQNYFTLLNSYTFIRTEKMFTFFFYEVRIHFLG